jgi:uncharacterized protein YjiS (DUF1127 family)
MSAEHLSGQANTGPCRYDYSSTPAAHTVAVADRISCEAEREIERAVALLAKLDDRTLRDLGIPNRSYIEYTVRYCRDC